MRILLGPAVAAAMALSAAALPAQQAPDTSPASAAATAEKSGVTMPTHLRVENTDLVLNGMALRKKAIFKVYVAGLYLPAKSGSAEEILAADAPRRMVLEFVRGVDKGKICDAWQDGLEKNTPDASAELKQKFVELCGFMADVQKGEQLVFTYLPGRGTAVAVKGETRGTIAGKDFADALFKSWIGPKPGPGEGFKKELLGQKG